jgi:hypothetical protein
MRSPRIELLHTKGCANAAPAGALLQEVVDALAPGATVAWVPVVDEAQARALGFPGSPTIRFDGVDIEPAAPGRAGLW